MAKRPQSTSAFLAREERQQTARLADSLRAENSLLKAKIRALQQEAHAQDRIVEYARLALESLALPPMSRAVRPAHARVVTRESAVLLGSCYHIGETVRAEEVDGLNAYDFNVFCCRYQRIIDQTIEFLIRNMRGYAFDELHFIHTGDAVSGTIHDELLSTNQVNIVEQATLGALVIAQGLRELAAIFPKVIFTGVVGNHGRLARKPYFKHKQQLNWDYVLYNYVAALCRKIPNISFQIPLAPWATVVIRGYAFHVSHGDQIRAQFSIPFYGIQRDTIVHLSMAAARQRFLHYFIRSHFHTQASLQTTVGENILNGSLKGACEFGANFGATDPTQLLFGVHAKYGMTWRLPINAKYAPTTTRYTYARDVSLAEQLAQHLI